MADKNIFIENNEQNIFIIDPNRVTNPDGSYEDRYVNHEELVMYVNLECNIQQRSKLLTGGDSNETQKIGVGVINFLKPNGTDYMTSDWTKSQLDVSGNTQILNSELLGITSVEYKILQGYAALVTIRLEDVKGRAMFEGGDRSPYSAFFNLPYPTFYLTVKGYYGKAIKYPLLLKKFSASFNQSTSNFDITLNFEGYQFSILNDVSLGYALSAPQMYLQKSVKNKTGNATLQDLSSSFNASKTTTILSQKGFEKLKTVYQQYKNKKLIDDDFPVLTIQDLIVRLENFITGTLTSYGQISVEQMDDISKYRTLIEEYRKQIISLISPPSWFNKYIDLDKPYVVLNGNEKIVYYSFKSEYATAGAESGYSDLSSIFAGLSEKTFEIKTFRSGDFAIVNDMTVSDVYDESLGSNSFSYSETFSFRNNGASPDETQLNQIKTEIDLIFATSRGVPVMYTYDAPGKFNNKLALLEKKLNDRANEIEDKLSKELAELLKSPSGLGFKPTIRNIIAVIMASTEAFLRLMDDVHKKAFDNRENSKKIQAVVEYGDIPNKSEKTIVYPWPQYAVSKNVDGQQKFECQYPGDRNYINQTGAYDYNAWPEVEFVEEFTKAFIQRKIPPITSPPPTDTNSVNRILVSGFDTVPSNKPYSNLVMDDFIFEMGERLKSISQYQGFQLYVAEGLTEFISDIEHVNIIKAIVGQSTELVTFLKQFNFTPREFNQFLSSINNEKYINFSLGNVSTPYLKENIEKEFLILEKDLPVSLPATETEKKFTEFMFDGSDREKKFLDTYPFIDDDWNRINLAKSDDKYPFKEAFKTSNSLFYNESIRKVANYKTNFTYGKRGNKSFNRPVTNFSVLSNKISQPADLNVFYSNRTNGDMIITEGNLFYKNNADSLIGSDQTTSMLNTPYFINALQLGVEKQRNEESDTPYIEASYLFLNSLPLATLRERYKSRNLTAPMDDELDYIFATIKKFGGVHSVPKIWLAKLGSIWYRYTNYIENNKDILDAVWVNFDYKKNWDPANSDVNKTYSFNLSSGDETTEITLQQTKTVDTSKFIDILNLGFYPKLVNDFSYFFNGEDFYTSTEDIQYSFNQKFGIDIFVKNPASSSITKPEALYKTGYSLNINTWSILIRDKSKLDNDYYIPVPSFGSVVNQLNFELFNLTGQKINYKPIFDNPAIYNGSVRALWGSPNYGYFDNSKVEKPPFDKYLKKILTGETKQSSFDILSATTEYNTIEEIFSVFNKDELDEITKIFLEFSKPSVKTTEELNFQKVYRKLFSDSYSIGGGNDNSVVSSIQDKQIDNLVSNFGEVLNENTIFKKGNPYGFNYVNFNILSDNPSPYFTASTITYQKYNEVDRKVPRPNITTLQQSIDQNPDEWKALRQYVGFSTMDFIKYSNTGSTITDFFVDLDVAFTVDNIKRFNQVIKLYATQKYNKLKLPIFFTGDTVTNFKKDLGNTIDTQNTFYNLVFSLMTTKLQQNLPDLNKPNVTNEELKKTEGDLTKFEYYDTFKAINDKWIAGNNYESDTIFEDILFLDRACRNVGDKIYVDVLKTKNYLEMTPTVQISVLIDSIVRDCHFVPFSVPAYINFYNASKVGDRPTIYEPNDFANTLFGTFDTVDYQSSRFKMVCTYVDQPSTQLNNPNDANDFKDDGIRFDRPGELPLLTPEPTTDEEFALTNKVCGFAVDFGLQNQSIFQTVNVSQEQGKPTSESLQMEYQTANLSAGIKTSTQTVSLFNIYKQRSYGATVTSMGNVMIQPTMYFILRNVPLFSGSYLITEVSHTINRESFVTMFSGTRQKIATLPAIDNILHSVNRDLFTRVVENQKQQVQNQQPEPTNTIAQKNSITNSQGTKTLAETQKCRPTNAAYEKFPNVSASTVTVTYDNMIKSVTGITKTFTGTTEIIFNLMSLESNTGNGFTAYNNNFSGIILDVPEKYGGKLSDKFKKSCFCILSQNNNQISYADFETLENHLNFLNDKYSKSFNDAMIGFKSDAFTNQDSFAESFIKVFIEKFPYDKTKTQANIYDTYKSTNLNELTKMQNKVKQNWKFFHKVA